MRITRRAFSRGIGGLFGGAFVPGGKLAATVLPAGPGFDDAYEKLLSEYIRVEKTAIAAGRTTASQTGAATWEGRQLEGFIAELDGRVDIKATARQIYAEFKERFRAEARKMRTRLEERAKVGSADRSEELPETSQSGDDDCAAFLNDGVAPTDAAVEQAVIDQRDVSGHPSETEAGGDEP